MNEDLINKFGEVIDEYLKENQIGLLLEFPKGTLEPELISNMPENTDVFNFYLLCHGMTKVINNLIKAGKIDSEKVNEMVHSMCSLIEDKIKTDLNGEIK